MQVRGLPVAGSSVLLAEEDLGHLDRVLRAFRGGHRAHVGLVAVLHVRVDHVEVPLVDRQVDRLADGPARVVQRGRHVGELHEVAEVLDARVAAPLVEVAHEGGAVGRGEHGAVAADDDVAGRVAGVLGEFARCRALHQRAAHAAREADALALDVSPGGLPQRKALRIIAEVQADLLEDRVGIVLEQRQALLAQDLVVRDVAGDVGDEGRAARGAGGDLGITAARATRTGGRGRLLLRIHGYPDRGRCGSRGPEKPIMVPRGPPTDRFAAWTSPSAPPDPTGTA